MDPSRTRRSAETLRRLEQNDLALKIVVVKTNPNGQQNFGTGWSPYYPTGATDLARLGAALANNAILQGLSFWGSRGLAEMTAGNAAFWEGLETNTSIKHLSFFQCNHLGEFEQEIMSRMADNNNLKTFMLHSCGVDARDIGVLTSILSGNNTSTSIGLLHCNIDDGILGKLIVRLRGLHQLKGLNLSWNNFGEPGCEAIATLLRDPNSNLVRLDLILNRGIDDDCVKILANSLEGNCKLEKIDLDRCAVTASGLESAFSEILSNPHSANETYLSNHTLRHIGYHLDLPANLSLLLSLNPIDKILRAHANLDMTKMLEWDQKLLPRALLWLEKARQCPTAGRHNIEARGLSIIYQFVRALPMAAVPPTKYELKEITRHHGLKVVESKDGYVVGDRVYTNPPSAGPWGYVVGHTGSSVFITMNHANVEGEIIQRKNSSVWNAPMLLDEASLAARQQRERLKAITLRHGLKRAWNEDGYAVGDKVYLNPFVGSGNCSKRRCGIWGFVVGHTRSSVWIATDHTRVDSEVIGRWSSSVSKTPMHRWHK